jgi:hypothetical protein
VSGPFVSVYSNQQHFAYRDSVGRIWDSWWNGDHWNLQLINMPGGRTPNSPAAVSGPFVSVYDNQQHFAYRDNAGTIWDSWWDGDNNSSKLQRINAGANLIYLLDKQHVMRSNDGGKTWQVDISLEHQLTCAGRIPIERAETDASDVVLTDMQFDPFNPLTRFAVGLGGAFFTNDGVNWGRLLDTGYWSAPRTARQLLL